MALGRFLIFLLAILFLPAAIAADQPVDVGLISNIQYIQENVDSRYTLHEVQHWFEQGHGQDTARHFLTFGISHKPVWIRLVFNNSSTQILSRRLTAGQTWIESLDVYFLEKTGVIQHWHTGDGEQADAHLLPGVGFVFDLEIPPGSSEVLIRCETSDPLTVPIQLLDSSDSRQSGAKSFLATGVLYGVLLALIGFNVVLFSTLKQLYALYYSIYIGCFIVMNFGYSGYGFSWIYPNSPGVQNYSTLFFMVLHGICGLLFVSNFLNLSNRMPSLNRGLRIYIGAGCFTILSAIALQQHLMSSYIAFGYLALTTLFMIGIGLVNIQYDKAAIHFTIAVCFSMVGLLITTLSVWGLIPYTPIGFHSAEIGVLCESVLLTVVVAYRLKFIEQERTTAQYLATHDPLTKLLNRRAFEKEASRLMHSQNHPFSLVMMDIDYFKSINDSYGHHVGDLALIHIASLLRSNSRQIDLISRWGGEEIVILLPETDINQAIMQAEHLHKIIKNSLLNAEGYAIPMTASFGVVGRRNQETLESMLKRSDERLYIAKNRGRDQVEPQLLNFAND